MNTQSVWQRQRLPRYPQLKKARRFDVVVIGGGMTGLTAAYLLKKSGRSVALLERDRLAGGDTAHTTAHLTYATDLRLGDLAKTFGKAGARLAWQGGAAAINTIERIAAFEKIDCDFRRVPGYLHSPLDDTKDDSREFKREAKLAQELGFAASFVERVPFFDKPGIRFADQARFHPLAYLAGLAPAVDGDGSAIFEQTEVKSVEDDGAVVTTTGRRIAADYVVIATHVPVMGKSGMASAALFQSKLFPYSSYGVGAKFAKGALPEALFWDTSDPYYYLRVDRHENHDYLIFGGEDHKTGQASDTEERFQKLTQRLLEFAPRARVTDRWSGQVIETNDGLPFMGETAERQFAATGFSGNGITFGTLAAMMACDAALGRENPWKQLFDVRRTKLRGGTWDYLKENFDYPYYLVRDRLAGADGTSVRSVKPGEGKILKIDGQRIACSRDDQGKLSKVSAECTHLGTA